MITLKDFYRKGLSGKVNARWVCPETGLESPVVQKDNVIVYNAADIMAHLLSGDVTYTPSFIGYIYAPNTKTMTNPTTIGRSHTWEDIEDDVRTANGNMILSPLGAVPLFDQDGTDYESNVATLNALSDETASLVFNGTGFATTAPQAASDQYFQAVLIARRYVAGSPDPVYVPFARTQFTSGVSGVDVQASLQLSVYWTFTFK